MISPSSALALIAPGDAMDITQVHAELSWIESRALDAGNSQGDTMAGPLTVPGLVLGGVNLSTNGIFFFGSDSGTVNNLAVTTNFPSAMAIGQVIAVKVANTNTGSATLNVNSLGAYTIFQGGVQLTGGELPVNSWVLLEFGGSSWNVIGMAPGGSPNVAGIFKGTFVGTLTGTFNGNGTFSGAWSSLPSGTRMLFQQSSVPPGWTQDTSVQNDSLLRMVNGAGGGVHGGYGVSSVLWGGASSDGTAISVSQMPSHSHGVNDPSHSHWQMTQTGGGTPTGGNIPCGTGSGALSQASTTTENAGTGISIQNNGGGATHSHTLSSLNVNSIDVIVGVKI